MAFSQGNMPLVPSIPGQYSTTDNIVWTKTTSDRHSMSEDLEGSLSEALLDPESELVRQQMLYLLLAKKGRPPPPKPPQTPPPAQNSNSSDGPPLYIPTIGFENRATRQRNIQEFVSASDQYRLGFSARTKHIGGIAEMEGDSIHEMRA